MSPAALALLGIVPPAAVALLLAVAPPLRRAGKPAIALSIAAAAAAFLGSLGLLLAVKGAPTTAVVHEIPWLLLGGQPFATLGLRLDGISAAMLVVVTAVALAVQVYSASYLHDEPPAALGRYYACQSLFLLAMNTLVLAPNLLQLFIGWELVGLASFLLIGFWYRKPSAARAALKAFWMTKLADSGFIVALVVLAITTGSFSWETSGVEHAGAITLLLFLAVMGKSAQFPLHVWLPDAMEGPTPVSALLHAATMVAAGVYLVVRAFPLFEQAPGTLELMAYLGAGTAVFAGCIAVVQSDIKKVLAYSTCSQLGYMFAGLGSGSAFAGFFHLTTHAAFKAMLFLAAGSVIHAVHSNELGDMGGLWTRMRATTVAFVVGALALAGVPGLAGFFSKDVILEAAAHAGRPVVMGLLVAAAALTAFYMMRTLLLAFFGKGSKASEHAHEAPAPMLVPVLVLLVPSIVLGYWAGGLAGLMGVEHHFHVGTLGIWATAAAFAGLAFAWLLFGIRTVPESALAPFSPLGRLARSGAVDGLHLRVYRHVLRGVGRVAAWVDRYVVDAIMNVVGWAFVAGGRRLRAVQTGDVGDYVWAVMAAAALVLAFGALR